MQKATLIGIAQRTGFSVSTVSRILSGQAEKYRISKKAVEAVCEEARRCNYTPSLLAKSLRMNKTFTLGLLIPGVDNPYFANIASAVIHEAKTLGYQMIIIDTLEDAANEREGIASATKFGISSFSACMEFFKVFSYLSAGSSSVNVSTMSRPRASA